MPLHLTGSKYSTYQLVEVTPRGHVYAPCCEAIQLDSGACRIVRQRVGSAGTLIAIMHGSRPLWRWVGRFAMAGME